MTKLAFLKLGLAIILVVAGSHTMELPKNTEESKFVNHEISIESEKNTQLEANMNSQMRINTLSKYFNKDRFRERFRLPQLRIFMELNSILAEDIKAIAHQKIPDATEVEIRRAMESLYLEKRIFELYQSHKFYYFFVGFRGKEQMSLSKLESLIMPNSILPDDIKALAWKALSDASEEEIRRVIEIIYMEIKTPYIVELIV